MPILENMMPKLKPLITDLSELTEYVQEAKRIIEKANIHIFLEEDEVAQLLRIKVEELRQRRLKIYLSYFFEYRRITAILRTQSYDVNRKCVSRLTGLLGLRAYTRKRIYPGGEKRIIFLLIS